VFPHDVAPHGTRADLSVALGIDVVLVGLPPVYAHGLSVGISTTGPRSRIVQGTEELGLPPEEGRTLVAVMPSGAHQHLAGLDGLRHPTVHVLADASELAYSAALRAGATGAFAHDAELADIVRIVLCAGLGLTLLPVDVARALNRRSVGPRPHLTNLDLQYLRMLANGATIASISRRFNHSEREMYRLLSSTYQRLGARNRTDALLLAQRFDLLDEGT
jgi:DNA-binding NarL/FixJ family response regulator